LDQAARYAAEAKAALGVFPDTPLRDVADFTVRRAR